MNRFLTLITAAISAMSGCAVGASSYRYDPAGISPRIAPRPSAALHDPFASDALPAMAVEASLPRGPSAAVPPKPYGSASLHTPFGCDASGILSLEVVNKTTLAIAVFVDGVRLVPIEGEGLLVAPRRSIYTCLPGLGTHRIEVASYTLMGVEAIPLLVRTSGESFAFCEDYGVERRQTVYFWGKDLQYSGWRC
ncbi:MAG: hypothetical protein AAB562_01285 [Patescibacteria group bacterium]